MKRWMVAVHAAWMLAWAGAAVGADKPADQDGALHAEVFHAMNKRGGDFTLEALREWARERLASYKLPSRLRLVEALPRNAMGKVLRKDLAKLAGG